MENNIELKCNSCGHEKRSHSVFSGCVIRVGHTGDDDLDYCDCERFEAHPEALSNKHGSVLVDGTDANPNPKTADGEGNKNE